MTMYHHTTGEQRPHTRTWLLHRTWQGDMRSIKWFIIHVMCVLHCNVNTGISGRRTESLIHDDVIKWKHFPRYWPFVRGIHRTPVNSPHKGPVTRSLDVFFDLLLNKRLSKQSWGWWFETPSCPLWRHCNGNYVSDQSAWWYQGWGAVSDLSLISDLSQEFEHDHDDLWRVKSKLKLGQKQHLTPDL